MLFIVIQVKAVLCHKISARQPVRSCSVYLGANRRTRRSTRRIRNFLVAKWQLHLPFMHRSPLSVEYTDERQIRVHHRKLLVLLFHLHRIACPCTI